MSTYTAKNIQVLRNAIMRVRQDVKGEDVSLEGIPLERLVENYTKLKTEVVKEMEKCCDPVFLEVLEFVQAHFTHEEFLAIQIEVYAACNKAAMLHCTPVDRFAHLVVLHE